jgi:Xaa-Pro dipeptidase
VFNSAHPESAFTNTGHAAPCGGRWSARRFHLFLGPVPMLRGTAPPPDKEAVALASVSPEPPAGLVEAQLLAIKAAEAACEFATPGMTERELVQWAEDYARDAGATGFWDGTLVGFGPGTLRCFPTEKPTDRPLWNLDLGHIDILPITADGWWGDCSRAFQRGDNPAQRAMLDKVQEIHETVLAAARPGMAANELYAVYADECDQAGLLRLDRLGNVGHSLGKATSYDEGYIDPWNETEMWGAWAIEPFVGDYLQAIKVEDVVWFGTDRCTVIR